MILLDLETCIFFFKHHKQYILGYDNLTEDFQVRYPPPLGDEMQVIVWTVSDPWTPTPTGAILCLGTPSPNFQHKYINAFEHSSWFVIFGHKQIVIFGLKHIIIFKCKKKQKGANIKRKWKFKISVLAANASTSAQIIQKHVNLFGLLDDEVPEEIYGETNTVAEPCRAHKQKWTVPKKKEEEIKYRVSPRKWSIHVPQLINRVGKTVWHYRTLCHNFVPDDPFTHETYQNGASDSTHEPLSCKLQQNGIPRSSWVSSINMQ
jgi:hypothetical protein